MIQHIPVAYAFVCVCLAFIVKGLAGFGDPLISNPLLTLRLNNSVITPGLLPVSILTNIQVVWKNRSRFHAHLVMPIAVCVLLGSIPGTLLLRYGAPQILKLVLGLLITGLGVEMLTRKETPTGRPSPVLRSILSFFSGVTAGLFGINLLFLVYLERVARDREDFRANTCFVFLLESLFRLVLYLANRMFTPESLILSGVAIPAALLGMWIGSLLDRRFSDRVSRKIICLVFLAGGVSTTLYALTALL